MRRTLPATLAMAAVLAGLGLTTHHASAQSGSPTPIQVTIEALGAGGTAGLAILTVADAGTAVQVLAVNPPAGTTVVIQTGTCAAIDPPPVGLLGAFGDTGQIQVTLPIALAALADGHHLIAFHPGLDLATGIGCGVIPATAVAGPTPPLGTPAPSASLGPATSYTAPTFGFTLRWNDPWHPQLSEPQVGVDAVVVEDGVSSVSLAGYRAHAGDPAGCISDWEGRLLTALRDGRIAELGPVSGADGQPVAGGDGQRAQGAYRYTFTTGKDAGAGLVEAMDCRRLSADAVLEILLAAPEDQYPAEASRLALLLEGLTLGEPTPASTPSPVASLPPAVPTPAPTPPPTPLPTATPNTDCDAIGTWITATLARLDRIVAIGKDADTASAGGMDAYARQLALNATAVQDVLLDAQRGPVPTAAATVDGNLRDALTLLVTAYDVLADAYRTGNASELQDGLSKAGQVEQKVSAVRSGLRDLATPCGLRIPTA